MARLKKGMKKRKCLKCDIEICTTPEWRLCGQCRTANQTETHEESWCAAYIDLTEQNKKRGVKRYEQQ